MKTGIGLDIVSIYASPLEPETGRLAILKVKLYPILRHGYLVHSEGKCLSPVAEAIREFVLARAGN